MSGSFFELVLLLYLVSLIYQIEYIVYNLYFLIAIVAKIWYYSLVVGVHHFYFEIDGSGGYLPLRKTFFKEVSFNILFCLLFIYAPQVCGRKEVDIFG